MPHRRCQIAGALLSAVVLAVSTFGCCAEKKDAEMRTPIRVHLDVYSCVGLCHGEVFLDGDLVSNAIEAGSAIDFHVTVGAHTLVVKLDGYQTMEKRVRILRTELQEFRFALKSNSDPELRDRRD